jgi:DNA-binding transcriptional LysR family regulator
MLPSGSDLQYFVTVAQLGSLSKAAIHLGVAQPSLSLAMQRLEGNLGTSLFVRSRQGVKVTKAGEKLLTDSRELLQRWEQLKSNVLSTTNEVRGRFALGCHPSVAIYSLPLFLPKLLKDNANLEIHLVHDLSRAITQKVTALEVDMGIVVNPVSHADLVIKALTKDEVTLWRSANLKNDDVLICEPSLLQTQDILRKLAKQGRHFRRTIECSNLEVIVHMAVAGVGYAILPARVAQTAVTGLKAIANSPKFYDEVCLIYRSEHRNVCAIQTLSKAIQDGFR